MKKINLVFLILVVIIILAIFLFPKENNIWDDSFTAHGLEQYKNMDCTCIGFTGWKPGITQSSTQVKLCYGVPINCKFTCSKVINEKWQNVSCNELD